MINSKVSSSISVIVLTIFAVHAAGSQIQRESSLYEGYYPRGALLHPLGLYYGDEDPEAISNKPTKRGLDSLSGATFGGSKRSLGPRRLTSTIYDLATAKRNIDEIDRTDFDSFFKRNVRNFDEIDRVGFAGFVKRLDELQPQQQQLQPQQFFKPRLFADAYILAPKFQPRWRPWLR